MLQFLRWVRICFWGGVGVLLATLLTIVAVAHQSTIPAWSEITEDNIVSQTQHVPSSTIKKSRDSAVLVKSTNIGFWSGTATMTGTYFISNDKHYVITVHHGIHGPCWLVRVIHGDESYKCKEFVAMDEANDYVIMEMETPLHNRQPLKMPQDLPHGPEWKPSYSILNRIIYTGYPNAVGPLTLGGDVVGYGDEYVYIFSHAYGGASGSGVFTHDGKYIGYIVAIDVGSTEFGPDVLENLVIVAPAFNVDWGVLSD